MRAAYFVLALLSLVAAVYAGEDVVALKGSNFENEISKHNISLVKFYAPWCGHCKALAEPFQEASTLLKSDNISLFDVNCDEEKDLCQTQEVQGYPTLKIFRNGKFLREYGGPRSADGIAEYMRTQDEPSSVELESVEAFDKFIHEDDYSVVGFFETESDLKKAFSEVADAERDRFRFAYVTNASVLEKTNNSDSIIVFVPSKLHNLFEPNEFKYEGEANVDEIKRFLFEDTSGLAGIISPSNIFKFQKFPLAVTLYDMDYVKDLANTTKWRNYVLETAQSFKDKVSFAVGNKSDFLGALDAFGLGDRKDSVEPLVLMIGENGRFSLSEDFSVENLKKFVTGVLSGDIKEIKLDVEKDGAEKDEGAQEEDEEKDEL